MLHILLMLLRILLIIIGVVVALILIALLLVLFCPFRYSASGNTSPSLEGTLKLTWLFHGVTVTLGYRNRATDFQIRIFGVSYQRYLGLFKRMRERFSRGQQKNQSRTPPVSGSGSKTPPPGKPKPQQPPPEELPGGAPVKEEEQQEEQQKPSRIRSILHRISSVFQKLSQNVRRVLDRIRKLRERVVHTFQRISHTLHNLRAFMDRWRRFFEDEKVQAGIATAWQDLKKLLKHVSPRKIKGTIRFGFENPATTGEVLAVIGVTCPIHKNVLTVIPDFENQVFEGDLLIKGRVYLFVVLYRALHLYMDKNFKYLMSRVRQKEG